MTWKSEIDRVVHEAIRFALGDRRGNGSRAIALANDYVALNPARPQSHYTLGLVEETVHLRALGHETGERGGRGGRASRGDGRRGGRFERADAVPPGAPGATQAPPAPPADDDRDDDAREDREEHDADERATDEGMQESEAQPTGTPSPAPVPVLVDSADGDAALWRFLGRLDAASKGGPRARVCELAADPQIERAVEKASEGRMVLRAVARPLLFTGADARAYDLTLRLIRATGDEGAKRDADGLVGDAARHADDLSRDGDDAGATAALERAMKFAADAGLAGRAAAKIQRKVGRSKQLEGRWAEATESYRDALSRLAPDDRYRSVLQGDLALAALEVRGTLDLLPKEGRGNVEEAERLLSAVEGGSEGESYNAIYTLGVLAYERGDFEKAATRFREADRLMRETRAKARIVHARARFFLGACLLRMGATGEALREAEHYVTRDASAAALETSVKEPVYDLLAQALPGARIPGRAPPADAEEQPRDEMLPRADLSQTGMPPTGMPQRDDRGPPRERGQRGGRGRGGRGRSRGFEPERAAEGEQPVDEALAQFGGEQRPPTVDDHGERGFDARPPEQGPPPVGSGRGRDRGGFDRRPAAPERLDRYAAGRGDRPRRAPRPDFSQEVHPSAAPAAAVAPTAAASHLANARRVLDSDSHAALQAVDETFRARPTFEEWNAAYRIRLEALTRLGEKTEALRTYERFRAKVHERARPDRLEELLTDPSSPMPEILDDAAMKAELVDLYGSMTGRERAFVEAATALATQHADAGTPADLRKAICLLREAVALGGDDARGMWSEVAARARAAGIAVDGPAVEDVRARLLGKGDGARVIVVAGDDSSRSHGARVEDVGRRLGFEGSLIVGGARPYQRTLEDVEARARGATAIVLLHNAPPELRDGVKRLAITLSVPVREMPYAGPASLEPELLQELSSI